MSDTDDPTRPAVSRRLVRAYVRYLEGRIGPPFAQFVDGLPPAVRPLCERQSGVEWVAMDPWLQLMTAAEERFGDRPTWRLVREATRATMAEAVSRAWSAFLSDITPDLLLQRADTFWKMSYRGGTLVVDERHPRSVRMAVADTDGWQPPPPVGVILAEACAVFLARLGERAPRAILLEGEARLTVELSW